jgi:uncharacterized Zn-finger protein
LKNNIDDDLHSRLEQLNSKVDQGKVSENEWKCLDCGKMLRWRGGLKVHYRLRHMDDRPYACPECPKAFKLSSTRRSHIRNMHGSGPDGEAEAEKYPCTVCGKMFMQASLKRHMLLHEHKVSVKVSVIIALVEFVLVKVHSTYGCCNHYY